MLFEWWSIMFFTKMRKSFFTLSTLESFTYVVAFVSANVYSYYDEADHTFLTRMLACFHTAATLMKIKDNFARSSQEEDALTFKGVTTASTVCAAGTLVSTCLVDNPGWNLVSAATNASCNFFGRLVSSSYRKHVEDVKFDSLGHTSMADDPGAIESDADYHPA